MKEDSLHLWSLCPGLAFITDEKGRQLFVNAAFEKFFDVNPSQWKGKTLEEIYPGDHIELIQKNDQKVLYDNSTIVYEVNILKQGVVHTFVMIKFPIRIAEHNPLIGGISIDVTSNKNIQKQLEKSREEYRQLFEMDLTGDFEVTAAGRLLNCNPALPQYIWISHQRRGNEI